MCQMSLLQGFTVAQDEGKHTWPIMINALWLF